MIHCDKPTNKILFVSSWIFRFLGFCKSDVEYLNKQHRFTARLSVNEENRSYR